MRFQRPGIDFVQNAAAVTPFNANSFTGCYWWHDYSDVAQVTTSGGNITAVADKGPNGMTMSSNTGTVSLHTAAYNGLQCAGISGAANMGGTTPATGTSALHLFFVLNIAAVNTHYQEMANLFGNNVQLYLAPSAVSSAGAYGAQFGSFEVDAMVTGFTVGALCLLDYAIDGAAKTIKASVHQGGSSFSSSTTSFSTATSITGGQTVEMPYGGSVFSGDFCEDVAWNVIKSGTEYATIVSQLQAKWGF